jgi:phage tail-like protein
VAGTLDPAGLLVFDLQRTGPPERPLWPAAVPFAPFDAAPTPDGGALILDRDHARLWALDSSLGVVPFGPARSEPGPEPGGFTPTGDSCSEGEPSSRPHGAPRIAASDALPLPGDPVAVEVLPDSSVLVLDRGDGIAASVLHRYRDGLELGEPVPVSGSIETSETTTEQIDVVGQDMVAVTIDGQLTLLVAERSGDQTYAFTIGGLDGQLMATLVLRYYPMRLFDGWALISDGRQAYYDSAGLWVPLVDQCRPRFATDAWLVTSEQTMDGRLESAAFDGREPGCVWHRLLLDARIPDACSVEVWSRAADEQWMLPGTPWDREPDPRERPGPDRPYLRQPDPYGTWELLFQRAQGRWLELKLHLIGDGRSSPHLHSLRATYPRFSYLREYLPKVYQEDDVSASFLDRYLANPEGIDTEIEDKVAAAQALLDPRAAPADTLDWLASFFDVALDSAWSEARRRAFLAGAMEFFRWRGTPHGLRMALRLALDKSDAADVDVFLSSETAATSAYRIVERFRLRGVPASVSGDPLQASTARPIDPGTRWKPLDGRSALQLRYGQWLGEPGPVAWPLAAPGDAPAAATWRAFNDAVLGFQPSATSGDLDAWDAFLQRRYRTLDALSSAYGQTFETIDDVALPEALPADGAPLRDWYDFETVVLAMGRAAHRFTVLLPVPVGESAADAASDQQRRDLATRIVELQKPAHTVFEVRFYWDAFRLGEARVGEGTSVGLGSRSPQLLQPVVLGTQHVGEAHLGGDPPQRLTQPPSFGRRATASESEQETT